MRKWTFGDISDLSEKVIPMDFERLKVSQSLFNPMPPLIIWSMPRNWGNYQKN